MRQGVRTPLLRLPPRFPPLVLSRALGALGLQHPRCGLPRRLGENNPPASFRRCRRLRFDPWVGKIPWRRRRQPTPVFSPGESHGQRILVGYRPRAWHSQTWLSAHLLIVRWGSSWLPSIQNHVDSHKESNRVAPSRGQCPTGLVVVLRYLFTWREYRVSLPVFGC